jgi:hypothetical protein
MPESAADSGEPMPRKLKSWAWYGTSAGSLTRSSNCRYCRAVVAEVDGSQIEDDRSVSK